MVLATGLSIIGLAPATAAPTSSVQPVSTQQLQQATLQTEPSIVPRGEETVVTGSGFQPGETVTVQLDQVVVETVADEAGDISTSIQVPDDYPWSMTGIRATGSEVRVSAPLTIVAPVVTVTPEGPGEEIVPEESVSIDGEGFAPDSTVTIEITDEAGDVIDTIEGVGTDDEGNFTEEWTAPATEAPVEVNIEATDDGEPDVTESETVEVAPVFDPTMVISPSTVAPGGTVTFESEGFVPDSTVSADIQDAAGNRVTTLEGTVDSEGRLTQTWNVPAAIRWGAYTIDAADVTDVEVTVSGSFTIAEALDPSVEVESGEDTGGDEAVPGEAVVIEGEGFAPESTVTVEIIDEAGEVVAVVEDVVTDDQGSFVEEWSVPEHVDAGELTVEVLDPNDPDAAVTQTLTIAETEDADPFRARFSQSFVGSRGRRCRN